MSITTLKGWLILLLAAFLLLPGRFAGSPAGAEMTGLQPPAGAADHPRVIVEPQTYDGVTQYATRYRAAREGCSISWIAYSNEPGVVKYEPDCPLALAEQLPLLIAICSAFLENDQAAAAFRTLFWGTFAQDGAAASRELSCRLATAALASPGWDRSRGRPMQGDINRFVRDLANQARLYPELQTLFAGFQRTVTLSHVEKVLVLPAGKLPFFNELEKLGAKADDRLPFDCMAWFAVTTAVEP